ncbi:MAG: hypothetical protein U1C18_00825, partial [Patescibacteria group bacterium]|nr:hypothetical protein [Patescibacteria group bacterium]
MRRFLIHTTILAASVALLYANWTNGQVFLVGLVGLALYYGVNAIAWGAVLERVLPFDRLWSMVFGWLVGFYLSAFAIGIPVVAWKYDRVAVALALLVVGLVGIILSTRRWFNIEKPHLSGMLRLPRRRVRLLAMTRDWAMQLLTMTKDWHVVGFIVLSVLFAFFIFHARTGVYIISPWAALSSFSLMLFFGLAFLVGYMALCRGSIKLALSAIII